jgi:hypothetical protein
MGPYFWFGAAPGQALPPIDGYESPLRATHNKQGERPPRQNHRLVPGKAFEKIANFEDVLVRLLGEFRYKLKTCTASDLSEADLVACAALVKNGGAVRGDCKTKLLRANELAVVTCGGSVVGIGAIKGARPGRASGIAEKSQFLFPPDTLELGYVSVEGNHKGNGVSDRITTQLLENKTTAFFATTDDPFMKRTLGKAGFEPRGQEWPGDRGQLSLWIRD